MRHGPIVIVALVALLAVAGCAPTDDRAVRPTAVDSADSLLYTPDVSAWTAGPEGVGPLLFGDSVSDFSQITGIPVQIDGQEFCGRFALAEDGGLSHIVAVTPEQGPDGPVVALEFVMGPDEPLSGSVPATLPRLATGVGIGDSWESVEAIYADGSVGSITDSGDEYLVIAHEGLETTMYLLDSRVQFIRIATVGAQPCFGLD